MASEPELWLHITDVVTKHSLGHRLSPRCPCCLPQCQAWVTQSQLPVLLEHIARLLRATKVKDLPLPGSASCCKNNRENGFLVFIQRGKEKPGMGHRQCRVKKFQITGAGESSLSQGKPEDLSSDSKHLAQGQASAIPARGGGGANTRQCQKPADQPVLLNQ